MKEAATVYLDAVKEKEEITASSALAVCLLYRNLGFRFDCIAIA